MTPLLACMGLVASLYHLPPRVLPSILAVEGGRPGTVHHNTDGSDDLGPMQVNSRWLPAVARYTGLAEADARARLLAVPCFNVAVAGAILRAALDETGGDLLRAVGNYHSHTATLNQLYQAKVLSAATALFPDRR
jgi:hypothetical protein